MQRANNLSKHSHRESGRFRDCKIVTVWSTSVFQSINEFSICCNSQNIGDFYEGWGIFLSDSNIKLIINVVSTLKNCTAIVN